MSDDLACFTDDLIKSGLDSWKEMVDSNKIEELSHKHDLTEHGLFVLFCMKIWSAFKENNCDDVERFVYDTAQMVTYAPLFEDFGDVDLAFDELLDKGFIERC